MEELLSTNGLIPHFSLSPYATSGNQFDQYKKMQKKQKNELKTLAQLATHLGLLNESNPMRTKMTGFRWFLKIFESL